MKRNTDIYLFPFQKVYDFLDSDVNKKLENFYASFQNEYYGHRIKSINKKKMEVEMYKDSYSLGELEYGIYTFENEIKFYFIGLIYKSFDLIAVGINIYFISNQSISYYLDKLERQFKSLLQHPLNKEFPFLKKYLLLIEKEILYYRELDGVKNENEIFKASPFKPKDNFKRAFFHRLYDISLVHDIIDENFSKEDFIEVFTVQSTKTYLTFKCNNSTIISFFLSINKCFYNLNALSIGNSKRFYTKQGKVFSSSNYDTSKGRYKSNPDIEDLKEDLEAIISEFLHN